MMATATPDTLPPTTQNLGRTQRANLIKSTRKLGAVLGEIPVLLDAPPPRHHQKSGSVSSISSTDSRRSGRIFDTVTPPPRGPSLQATQPEVPHGAEPEVSEAVASRPHMILRLAPSAPKRISTLSLSSPLSPGFPMSPSTPTYAVVDRRKQMMNKLVRTLGANVPPELVFSAAPRPSQDSGSGSYFPSSSSSSRTNTPAPSPINGILAALEPSQPQHRGSYESSLASPTQEASYAPYPPNYPYQPRSAALPPRRRDSGESWIELGAVSEPSSPTSSSMHMWNGSASADDLYLPPSTSDEPHVSSTTASTRDYKYFSNHIEVEFPALKRSAGEVEYYDYQHQGGQPVMYRKERAQGWSGEWSGSGAHGVGGMEDVVKNLRALKIK